MIEKELPNCCYRVSIKALIIDETRKKFAVLLEDNGMWELPGGGMDHGESPHDCLRRELKEEMGAEVVSVSSEPVYLLSGKNMKGVWSVGPVYEVRVKDLNFIPSDECVELRFVTPTEAKILNAFRTVTELAEKFVSA